MLDFLIKKWEENKHKLRKYFETTKQSEYTDDYLTLLKKIFEFITEPGEYNIEKITVVDNGDYQGTQIFLIPEDKYQPSVDQYIITHNYYGSCSGCDTLQAIHSYDYEELPSKEQVDEYMLLCLHLIQKATKLKDED